LPFPGGTTADSYDTAGLPDGSINQVSLYGTQPA
jgi:hypothetical protein